LKSDVNAHGSAKHVNRNTHNYFILLFCHIKIKVSNFARRAALPHF